MKFLSLVIILVIHSQVLCEDLDQDLGKKLVDICNSYGTIVEFTTIQEVREIIEYQLRTKSYPDSKFSCTEKYHKAFIDLNELINDKSFNEDICSDETYKKIRKFHKTFISYYLPEYNRDELIKLKANPKLLDIPQSLKSLFVSMVSKISAQCKQSLIERLPIETKDVIDEEDYDFMLQMKRQGARLFGQDYEVSNKIELDRLNILHLGIDSESGDQDDNIKLYIKVQFNDVIEKVKAACVNKFIPIYRELFMPLIQLNNLGYFIKEIESSNKDEEDKDVLNKNEDFTRWYYIIETCEVMKDIEVIQDTSTQAAIADLLLLPLKINQGKSFDSLETQPITILSKEEAEQVKKDIKEKISGGEEIIVYAPERVDISHKQIKLPDRISYSNLKHKSLVLKKFEKLLNKRISKKISFIRKVRNDIKLSTRKFWLKNKLQIKNPNPDSALGKVVSFLDKHQTEMRTAAAVMMLIVVVSVHFG